MPLASISARTRWTASARPSESVNRSRSVLTRPPWRDVNLRTVNPVSWDDTTPGPALVLVRRRAGPEFPRNTGRVPAARAGRAGRAQNRQFPSSARWRTLGVMTQLTGLAGDGSAGDNEEAAVVRAAREPVRPASPGAARELASGPGQAGALEEALGAVIAERVREFRLLLGLTVGHLAELTGLSKGMLSKIENAQASPSLATLARLSEALKVPVTGFFRGLNEEEDVLYGQAGRGLNI